MSHLTDKARQVFAKTVAECRGDRIVQRTCRREGSILDLSGLIIDLDEFQRVRIHGAGKAAVEMATGLAGIIPNLGPGIVATKHWNRDFSFPGIVIEAGHPEPNEASLEAGRRLLAEAAHMRGDDLVIFVLSGGASALLECPKPPLDLDDLVAVNRVLLTSGLPIVEMNSIRKRLSLIKNGGLARAYGEATVVCLVLSDVIGDDLSTIGSAPLLASPMPPLTELPPGLTAPIRQILEEPSPAIPTPRVAHRILANARTAAEAAANFAIAFGFQTKVMEKPFRGEAKDVGNQWARLVRQLPAGSMRICFGEASVALGASSGRGGRCQEAALAAALVIEGAQDVAILVAATDGIDGTGDCAGAAVDGSTVATSGLDAKQLLANHDSARFHEAAGSSMFIGPTGTNLNELGILVRG